MDQFRRNQQTTAPIWRARRTRGARYLYRATGSTPSDAKRGIPMRLISTRRGPPNISHSVRAGRQSLDLSDFGDSLNVSPADPWHLPINVHVRHSVPRADDAKSGGESSADEQYRV